MNIKIRKTILYVLSILATVLFTAGLAACARFDLTLKVPENIVFRVGELIDYFDFFEADNFAEYSATYSYIDENGEKTEEKAVIGKTFCPLTSSKYTLTVKGKKGGSKKTESITFDVYHVAPFIAVPKVTLLFNHGQTVRLRVILDKSSYILVSNTPSEVWVDSVSYKESVTPSIYNRTNDNEEVVTRIEKDTDGVTSFTFNEAGDYVFTLIAENAAGKASATVTAKVSESVTEEQVSVITEGKIESSKNAEFGVDENGRFTDTVRLIGGGNISSVSYVAMSKPYTIGQVIRLEFNGNEVPEHIGFLGDPEEGQLNPYSMTQGAGYVYGFSTSSTYPWCLYGYKRRGNGTYMQKRCTWGKENEQSASRFGLNDFDPSKRYGLEMCFKGVGEKYIEEETGILRYADVGLYWYLYEINETGDVEKSYKVVSVQLPGCEGSNISKKNRWYKQAKLVFYGSTSQDVTFKFYEDSLLGRDFSEETAIKYDETTKKISWDKIDGAENYIIRVNGETIRLYGKDKTVFDLKPYFTEEEFQVVNVSVTPSIGYNDYTEYSLKKTIVISPAGYENNALYKGSLDKTTNTVTLKGGGVKSNKFSDVTAFDNSYIAFTEQYGMNTRVDFWFKGNNMPQVCLFADALTGNMTSDGGNGLLLMNGFCLESGAFVPQYTQGYDANDWYIIAGMNKLDAKGSTCYGGSRDAIIDGKGFEANSLVAEKNYKYSVYTAGFPEDGGKWFIVIELYEVLHDGTETLVGKSYDFSQYRKSLPGYSEMKDLTGYIVCYAGVKGSGNDTVFRYTEPYACDNQGRRISQPKYGKDSVGDDYVRDFYG